MSASIFECTICFSFYNENLSRPLSLPCGHAFCEECLTKVTSALPKLLTASSNEGTSQEEQTAQGLSDLKLLDIGIYNDKMDYQIVCPADKKIHKTHPSKLPVCYAILQHLPHNQMQQISGESQSITINKPNTNAAQTINKLSSSNIQNNFSQSMNKSSNNMNTMNGGNGARETHQSNKHQARYVSQTAASQPQTNSCLRHPDKKIKFFCESDIAFLCSKCVIQHTGVGHIIKEYHVDTEKMRSDYQDVLKKYRALLQDSASSKHSYDSLDKKLSDMCNRQLSKLDLTYRSISRMLEQKRREFQAKIVDFYGEQRQKIEGDKVKSGRFYDKVKSVFGDMEQLGVGIMEEGKGIMIVYEEFFKIMNQKNKEVEDLQISNTQLARMAQGSEKSIVFALFSDQVKISDFGNVQYVMASEYKSGKQQQQQNQLQQSKYPQEQLQKSAINISPTKEGKKIEEQILIAEGEEVTKKNERVKALALDEKVSRKLNNIISRIHEHQPISTKSNSSKENLVSSDLAYGQQLPSKNEEIIISSAAPISNVGSNILLSSTTSINSSFFNKNLSSTLNQRSSNIQAQKQQPVIEQQVRGSSQHNQHKPQFGVQKQSEIIVDSQHPELSKNDDVRMLSQYEKNIQGNSTSRRITMVPSLRTDLIGNQGVNSRYGGGVAHKTQMDMEEQYSVLDRQNSNGNSNGQQNANNTVYGAASGIGQTTGSVTHRGEQLYGGDRYQNEYDYFGTQMEKDNKKQIQPPVEQQYSKYLNPIKNPSHAPFQEINPLLLSSETPKEIIQNPFENGLFRQSIASTQQDSLPQNIIVINPKDSIKNQASDKKKKDDLVNKRNAGGDRYGADRERRGYDGEVAHKKPSKSRKTANNEVINIDKREEKKINMDSDDELISNMLQDIQSKSQERRKPSKHHQQNHQFEANMASNNGGANGCSDLTSNNIDPYQNQMNMGENDCGINNKLSKYTSNHCSNNRYNNGSSGHQKKPKKEHSKQHHKSKKTHGNERHEKSQKPSSHKRNGSVQDEAKCMSQGPSNKIEQKEDKGDFGRINSNQDTSNINPSDHQNPTGTKHQQHL